MSLIESAIDTFSEATECNLDDPLRDGSLLCFANYGQVVMTGDLHGHRRNFEKIVKYCRLESTPIRHVIMHEMIHSEPDAEGIDRSMELLLDAAKWKTFFPDQVHFIQSNHELAQYQNHEITKGGRMVTDEFERGVAEVMGTAKIDPLIEKIDAFIASFPIAGRTANGIFLSHSLPDIYNRDKFDVNCIHQMPDDLDLSEGGSVYQLVWGRRQTPEYLEELARTYSVEFFITGHQPQDFGWAVQHDRMIILSTDNNHGVLLPIDCSKEYSLETLTSRIIPCAGIA